MYYCFPVIPSFLFVVGGVWFVVCALWLFGVWCLLCVVYGVLGVVWCLMCGVCCVFLLFGCCWLLVVC